MSRKKNIDLEQTRLNILKVGLSLLEQKGFNATGIQEITTIARIPKGSFYNYFASKEEFCVEIIQFYTKTRIEEWENLLEAEDKGDPYLALHAAFIELAIGYECADPKTGCLLGNLAGEISEVSEDCRMALQDAIGKFKKILELRLLWGQQHSKVRIDLSAPRLADLVWDVWQGSLLRMKIEKSAEPVRNTLETLFEKMLLP
ncbi:TetR/AcrR family transcriptional regulator [Pectinatus brassicae]|uniref:TetR/AcrR family transcriptional repressor of nem operon n=1 Tax=Pectinatus brassicae TaxID=862415 RepID=A0A840URI3_9FIRM|nr:TetR/AcrR family transcriptional regulator [Pectinatus brassicae]MBB5337348.1 TetR/AcrR family transcriptional repressor of nem operon [Pectinatus brassicae]